MKTFTIAALSIAMLSLSACSGDKEAPEADASTEVRMDEVDVIDGTISDDMVDVDTQESGDKLADGAEAEETSDDEEGNDAAEASE